MCVNRYSTDMRGAAGVGERRVGGTVREGVVITWGACRT